MHGWNGKLLVVNLGLGEIREESLDLDILVKFIGGRGIGAKILWDMTDENTDPLSPDNPLIIACGPLTGIAPMCGRYSITSKSPLTGTIFDSSAGGFFGAEFKSTGYDCIIITGASEKPVYLDVTSDEQVLKDAAGIWGLNTRDTTARLSKDGRSVACIGRAGERLIPIANIMSDYAHACGRGGLGAVMGSKNLKAVTVKWGRLPNVANKSYFTKSRREITRLLRANPVTSKGLSVYGTPVLMNLINYMHILPTDNYRSSFSEHAECLSGESINDTYDLKKESCHGCMIACKRSIKDSGLEVPEYETLWAFGADCNNYNLDDIVAANRLCNDYGVDTITCGSTIASYLEYTGKNAENLVQIVKEVCEGKGKGSELALGSKRYTELIGRD